MQHTLLTCPQFNDLRREVWEEEGGRQGQMDLREILNDPSKSKQAANFMLRTGILSQFKAMSTTDQSGNPGLAQ